MRAYTTYLTFKPNADREYVNITPQVEAALADSGVQRGHGAWCPPCTSPPAVWVNDAEDGLTRRHRRVAGTPRAGPAATSDAGSVPGAAVEILEKAPLDGPLTVRTGD